MLSGSCFITERYSSSLFHSLIATPNYQLSQGYGHNRTINRRKWNNDELSQRLMDENYNMATFLNGIQES